MDNQRTLRMRLTDFEIVLDNDLNKVATLYRNADEKNILLVEEACLKYVRSENPTFDKSECGEDFLMRDIGCWKWNYAHDEIKEKKALTYVFNTSYASEYQYGDVVLESGEKVKGPLISHPRTDLALVWDEKQQRYVGLYLVNFKVVKVRQMNDVPY